MRDLPKDQRPASDDPDFWNVWVGQDEEQKPVEREVDWKPIADDWQGAGRKAAETEASNQLEESGTRISSILCRSPSRPGAGAPSLAP